MGSIVNTVKSPCCHGTFIEGLVADEGFQVCPVTRQCRSSFKDNVNRGIAYHDFGGGAACCAGLLALCLVPHVQPKVWSSGVKLVHVAALSSMNKGLMRAPTTSFSEQDLA